MAVTHNAKARGTSPCRGIEDRWSTLRAKIEPFACLLAKQGVLVLKTMDAKRYWFLRFLLPENAKGHRRHRSIYIGREGDHELLLIVRQYLSECRETRSWASEVSEWANFAASLKRLVTRYRPDSKNRV